MWWFINTIHIIDPDFRWQTDESEEVRADLKQSDWGIINQAYRGSLAIKGEKWKGFQKPSWCQLRSEEGQFEAKEILFRSLAHPFLAGAVYFDSGWHCLTMGAVKQRLPFCMLRSHLTLWARLFGSREWEWLGLFSKLGNGNRNAFPNFGFGKFDFK